jgi:hypothetical protein
MPRVGTRHCAAGRFAIPARAAEIPMRPNRKEGAGMKAFSAPAEAGRMAEVKVPQSGLGLCRHCGHAKGYHYYENARCSDRECLCPGYESRARSAPLQGGISGNR